VTHDTRLHVMIGRGEVAKYISGTI